MRHWDIVEVVAFGIIVWIWNHLGLPERVALIGNVVAAILLVVAVFVLK